MIVNRNSGFLYLICRSRQRTVLEADRNLFPLRSKQKISCFDCTSLRSFFISLSLTALTENQQAEKQRMHGDRNARKTAWAEKLAHVHSWMNLKFWRRNICEPSRPYRVMMDSFAKLLIVMLQQLCPVAYLPAHMSKSHSTTFWVS